MELSSLDLQKYNYRTNINPLNRPGRTLCTPAPHSGCPTRATTPNKTCLKFYERPLNPIHSFRGKSPSSSSPGDMLYCVPLLLCINYPYPDLTSSRLSCCCYCSTRTLPYTPSPVMSLHYPYVTRRMPNQPLVLMMVDEIGARKQ